MHARRTTTIAIAILSCALVSSGAWLGTARGIDAPTEIVLRVASGGEGRDYPLRDADGHKSGSLDSIGEPLVDVDGNPVGWARSACFFARGIAWHCTTVITLHSGPNTEAGTIVVTGLFRGFNGERMAVTGGTGAYDDVGGSARLTVENDRFTRTLSLTP